ncbi:helix-turn-helix domain-containing protein [Sphingomonas sp. R86520]|uniref:helix-turn-helix domain-containing protein n=1 Tax=Sphingomonas sp. R86520 TaxID=3093859 RepID=UPI0036D2AACD
MLRRLDDGAMTWSDGYELLQDRGINQERPMNGSDGYEMTIGNRVKALRASRAMTQEDLAGIAGLGLATIQRVERGLPAAAGTIASLAAAFDLTASDLTGDNDTPDHQPYVPLTSITTGRQLESLLAVADRLDFGFGEIDDLATAELIEELETFCSPSGAARTSPGAVTLVKQQMAARNLLASLAVAGLAVTGANYSLNCAEIDDDMGAGMPILMAQWTSECAVIRVAAKETPILRAYIMDGLGSYEVPAEGVVWPQRNDGAEEWASI